MNDTLDDLMAQADDYARQLDALEPAFSSLGELEIQISFDALREELGITQPSYSIPVGAVRA